ncbi:hypothetical protein HK103_005305 [Boothiomyces macroporosus]|uniref:Uncharacterized protein n=1 Tax=Boothiomyces macroporosus TaxID=261099 RepID=A0AAD5UFB6_9FUNG|nr:hypothetical protein HK103_005305 [Boothiomyces macroporosus]
MSKRNSSAKNEILGSAELANSPDLSSPPLSPPANTTRQSLVGSIKKIVKRKKDNDQKDDEPIANLAEMAPKKVFSSNAMSLSTSGSKNSRKPGAAIIIETFNSKLKEPYRVYIAIIGNLVLLGVILFLQNGINIPLPSTLSLSITCVVIEVIIITANQLTLNALNDAAAAYFGYIICQKKGLSLAVCGFVQCSTFQKLSFANKLSLNSSCHRILSQIPVLWAILSLMICLSPFVATAILHETVQTDLGEIPCVTYKEYGLPGDRGWPNWEVSSGIGEFLFGSSLGYLRSEQDVPVTQAIIPPQILYNLDAGGVVLGNGFIMDISSHCQCAFSLNDASLMALNVSQSDAVTLRNQFMSIYPQAGIGSLFSATSSEIDILSVFSGVDYCAGTNKTNPSVPICRTSVSNYYNAEVIAEYMSANTYASLTPKASSLSKLLQKGDIQNWLYPALTNILEGNPSALKLPPSIPGAINPTLWWASPNLQSIDPVFMDAGVETLFAILFTNGIQRTYPITGTSCPGYVVIDENTKVWLADYGMTLSYVIIFSQLGLSLLSLIGFLPWLFSSEPIGPGVRFVKSPTYFTVLVASSNSVARSNCFGNAPEHVIWQGTDIVLRLGEQAATRADPELGHIVIDRPRMVSYLQHGKWYY